MTDLRIGVVTPSYPPLGGGIATAHYQMARALSAQYDVRVFAYDDGRAQNEPGIIRRQTPSRLKALLVWAMKQYVRRKVPTGQLRLCPSIASISVGAWRLRSPIVQFEPDVIISPDAYLPLYWLRIPPSTKTVWVSHNNYLRFRNNPLIDSGAVLDNDIARSMERKALHKADAVVCPSQYMVGEYHRAYDHALPLFMIHYFMDFELLDSIEAYPLRGELDVSANVPLVYIPSAGSVQKGKRHSFEIVRRLHAMRKGDVAFYLSGSIPGDLQYELDSIGGLKLHAPGHVEWSSNVSRAKACDLAVSPTLVENFSLAIIEGLAAGLPYVTFDTGGNAEMVIDGVSGAVVPYLDIEAMIRRAADLLDAPERLRAMGVTASERIRKQLDTNRLIQQYTELFEELFRAAG